MGFFDKLIGKREPKKQEARENQQQVTSVAPEISNSKPSVSDTFDYRNLFCHSLRLNVAAEKMGMSSEDFNKLFEDGNLEEKDENGNKILAGNVKNFQIAVQFNDKTITAVIKKIIDDLRAHQVTLTFDSFSHLETQRSIQDIELKSDGRYKSTNQILIERDPNRVEKVKYTHKRLRTDEECEAIEASIDNLYIQTPEGKTLLEQIESWEEATKESEPIRTEHQFYPSYSKNTVLIKQFDLSQITEDISTLECLHGVDDLKVSRLAEARELSLEAKSDKLHRRLAQSPRCIRYLKKLQFPITEMIPESFTKDQEVIADYLNKVRLNYERDKLEADIQNQTAAIYDFNGTLEGIYTENGQPINKDTIARMVENKKAQDKFYAEQAQKLKSERDTKGAFEYSEFD